MFRPLLPFLLAGFSGVLAFAPVQLRQYSAADEQGTRYAALGHLERGWVFALRPQGTQAGQALFETAHLVLNTPQELAAECHAYTPVGSSTSLLERSSFMVHRERRHLKAGLLTPSLSRSDPAIWLRQLTELCRSAPAAEKTLAPVRLSGHRYVPAETPQVAVLAVANGTNWVANVVKR